MLRRQYHCHAVVIVLLLISLNIRVKQLKEVKEEIRIKYLIVTGTESWMVNLGHSASVN